MKVGQTHMPQLKGVGVLPAALLYTAADLICRFIYAYIYIYILLVFKKTAEPFSYRFLLVPPKYKKTVKKTIRKT